MALAPCPECAREVSSQAKACPHCGFPFAKTAWSYIREWIDYYRNLEPAVVMRELNWLFVVSVIAIGGPFWIAPAGTSYHWIGFMTAPIGVAGLALLIWLSNPRK